MQRKFHGSSAESSFLMERMESFTFGGADQGNMEGQNQRRIENENLTGQERYLNEWMGDTCIPSG